MDKPALEIDRHQHGLPGRVAQVGHCTTVGPYGCIVASAQGGVGFAQTEQFFGEVEKGICIGLLGGDVALGVIRVHRQPGFGSGKTGILRPSSHCIGERQPSRPV